MWQDNPLYKEELESILSDENIPLKSLEGKTVLITGITGLLGGNLANALLYANRKWGLGCRVIGLVRNLDKAKEKFSKQLQEQIGLELIEGDVISFACDSPVHYIFHAASQTSSKGFVETPVDTIDCIVNGTKRVLELAKEKRAEVVFLSTMEVYGTPTDDRKITEDTPTDLLTTNVRNCYPIGKRLAENMCIAYQKQYGVPIYICRLTQTFGRGVSYCDGRVFAEFARCAVEGRDILLHTLGQTKRNYLYVSDAVRALLTILLKGQAGEAYNVANEDTYCSILEMAHLVTDKVSKNKIEVKIEVAEDLQAFGYAPPLCMNLQTQKLCGLGWKPQVDLEEAYRRLVVYFEELQGI